MAIELPLIERREIEASVLAPLIRAFAKELGEERTFSILRAVIRDLAQTAGRDFATRLQGNGIRELRAVVELWCENQALEIDWIRQDSEVLEFHVTRCRYAELYQQLGIPELGAILSCGRDGAMIAGFNPAMKFRRSQTRLGGAPYCDFYYELRPDPSPQAGGNCKSSGNG